MEGLIIIEDAPRNGIRVFITYQWWILFLKIDWYLRFN